MALHVTKNQKNKRLSLSKSCSLKFFCFLCLGVWKSGKPESGIGTGIATGTETGSGPGIGTGGMGRETYTKTGTTFTLIY